MTDIPESKYNKLWVVSAYINKKETVTQALSNSSQSNDGKSLASPVSTNSISTPTENVKNTQQENISDTDNLNPTDNEDTRYSVGTPSIDRYTEKQYDNDRGDSNAELGRETTDALGRRDDGNDIAQRTDTENQRTPKTRKINIKGRTFEAVTTSEGTKSERQLNIQNIAETGKKNYYILGNEFLETASAVFMPDSLFRNKEDFDVNGNGIVKGIKSEHITDIFNEQGNKAYRKGFGVVELSKTGAESTILHGYGKLKIAAIPAIKHVIENGDIISFTKNYDNKGYDRYIIAAKGKIDNAPAILGVVVKSYPKSNFNSKFYLHEAEILEADVSSMTAPQLSVDTVNTSASTNSIPTPTENVKNTQQENISDTTNLNPSEDVKFSMGAPSIDRYTRKQV